MSTAVSTRDIFTCPGRAGPFFRLDLFHYVIMNVGIIVTLSQKCSGALYKKLCHKSATNTVGYGLVANSMPLDIKLHPVPTRVENSRLPHPTVIM